MTSATYTIFRRAILARRQVTCIYRGCYRELCPHIIGHTKGAEKVLAYQFAGESRSGLPPGGEWRCLSLAEVSEVHVRDGRWFTGRSHTSRQSCVEDVELDVNVPRRGPRS